MELIRQFDEALCESDHFTRLRYFFCNSIFALHSFAALASSVRDRRGISFFQTQVSPNRNPKSNCPFRNKSAGHLNNLKSNSQSSIGEQSYAEDACATDNGKRSVDIISGAQARR
jgi:hypothetical protein